MTIVIELQATKLFFNVILDRVKDENTLSRWAELLSDPIYFFKFVTTLLYWKFRNSILFCTPTCKNLFWGILNYHQVFGLKTWYSI